MKVYVITPDTFPENQNRDGDDPCPDCATECGTKNEAKIVAIQLIDEGTPFTLTIEEE